MDRVAIVILNYMNYKDTIECVESVSIDNYPEKEIIIVDNGSPNESRTELEKKFGNASGIHLLWSDKNTGFAKGNNIGICFATNALSCKFVLVVNNDTIFQDPNMITILKNSYDTGIGILGPRIIGCDGQEQNPLRLGDLKNRSNLQQDLHYRRKIFSLRFNLWMKLSFKQSGWYQKLKQSNVFRKKKERQKNLQNNLPLESISSLQLVLQGACFLLTPDYFKYYPCLFPGTFLYYEEDILTMLTSKVKLHKKFIATTYIFHKENKSTAISFANNNAGKTLHHINSIDIARRIFPLDYGTLIETYFKK